MHRHLLALTIAAVAVVRVFAAAPSPAAAIIINGRPVDLSLACTGGVGAAEVRRASDGARVAALSCDPANPVGRLTVSDPEDLNWRVTLTIGDPNLRPTTCAYPAHDLPARLACAAIGDPSIRVDFAAIGDPNT